MVNIGQLGHTKRVGGCDQAYRHAFADLMDSLRPDFFVTFAFNRTTGLGSAQRRIERFQAMVDGKLLGTRWHKKIDQRTKYIAVVEHPRSNLHVHSVFLVPRRLAEFPSFAKEVWQKLAPAGDIDVQPYFSNGAALYSSKYMRAEWSDLILISPNASLPDL